MLMSKDLMTHGKSTWIAYIDENSTVSEKENPWNHISREEGQFHPIPDAGGVTLFRKIFTVTALKNARIDATSLGVFDLYCNGQRVGRVDEQGNTVFDEMKPGWTDYRNRALFYSYDLTAYLHEGENVLLAVVAPGWYNGRIGHWTYGEDTHVAFMAGLYINSEQGEQSIYTDETWEGAFGGVVRASDIWDGEIYDANQPDYVSLSCGKGGMEWSTVTTEEHDIAVTPHIGPTVMVRPEMTRTPASVVIYHGAVDNGSDYGKINVVRTSQGEDHFTLTKGETAIIDLGQNMVGWPVFVVKGKQDTWLQIRFGEVLNDSGLKSRRNDNPQGSVHTINYRSAKSKGYYVLRGDTNGEAYRPQFTFYGFRYCEITATDDVTITNFKALVLGSVIRETGRMTTSHKDVNQLISNILWGQRGNYLSVPTDCPQRDERLGWTGDTQAFCGTATYNADVGPFFHKWLQDARDCQHENGMYPDIVPYYKRFGWGAVAWADAGIIVPYTVWKMYGDMDILHEHYDSMERYMDWLSTTNHAGPHPTYGDWLAFEPTDKKYICVAYYALDAMYMVAMSKALGKFDRADHYQKVYEDVCQSFRDNYCDEHGDIKAEYTTQTGYLLALRVGLLLPERRDVALSALKQKIIDNGYRLSTGFVGSCIINEVLAEFGENNLAYSLLLQTKVPSWLHSVRLGATTIWERWGAYTQEDGFTHPGTSSLNHYAYGAVQEWMYRHMAGIETTEDAPGFAHPILQPKPDTRTLDEIPQGQERITMCKTEFDSPVGLITSAWDTANGFVYECTVPVASTLYLPILTDGETYTVNGEVKYFSESQATPCGKAVVIELQAGKYTFVQK